MLCRCIDLSASRSFATLPRDPLPSPDQTQEHESKQTVRPAGRPPALVERRSRLTCAPAESASILISAPTTHPFTQSTMVACTVTLALTHQPPHARTHSFDWVVSPRIGSYRIGSGLSRRSPARGSLVLDSGLIATSANMARSDAARWPSWRTQLAASYVGASRSPRKPVALKGDDHYGWFPAGAR